MAGFTFDDIRETPAAPMRAVFPSASIGLVDVTIAAGSYVDVKQGSTAAGTEPGSINWFIGFRPVLSFNLRILNNGGSLNIDLSFNGTNFYLWRSVLLLPLTPNTVDGLYLPGLMARFNIYNASTSSSADVIGHLKVEGA